MLGKLPGKMPVTGSHIYTLGFPDPTQRDHLRYQYRIKKVRAFPMFAIIETGGKQYKVNEGDVIFVEKLEVEEGSTITFDKVLAVSTDAGFKAGTPTVAGATVTANVVKNGKGKKIYVMTYKPKKNEKKKIGHRQPYTKVQIEKIAL